MDRIPNALAAALLADKQLREEFSDMYLVLQTALAELIVGLHQQGAVDAQGLCLRVRQGVSALIEAEVASDLAGGLAEDFQQLVQSALAPADD